MIIMLARNFNFNSLSTVGTKTKVSELFKDLQWYLKLGKNYLIKNMKVTAAK